MDEQGPRKATLASRLAQPDPILEAIGSERIKSAERNRTKARSASKVMKLQDRIERNKQSFLMHAHAEKRWMPYIVSCYLNWRVDIAKMGLASRLGRSSAALTAIAVYAKDKLTAYPSMTRLASDIGISERTLQRWTNELVEEGLLSIEPGAGRGNTNLFRIMLDRMISEVDAADRGNGQQKR